MSTETKDKMEWIGDKFVDAKGKELTRAEAIGDYEHIMILHSGSWCGGCNNFKNNLKDLYTNWNKNDAKKI
tara:strand:+ start:164 stop:376 length:213 start_codon:yes stop_codon:yes gene_type:complete